MSIKYHSTTTIKIEMIMAAIDNPVSVELEVVHCLLSTLTE